VSLFAFVLSMESLWFSLCRAAVVTRERRDTGVEDRGDPFELLAGNPSTGTHHGWT
jgi:hypothetical protein